MLSFHFSETFNIIMRKKLVSVI